MSRSDDQDDEAQAARLLEELAERDSVSAEGVRAVISAATRLYANACARAEAELPPLTPNVSTTDALTLACALLRAHDLTPFEMAMWFSRGHHTA